MLISHTQKNRLAVGCLLFSATMWGLIWYPLRLLDKAGMSATWGVFIIYFTAAIFTIPILCRQYKIIFLHKAELAGLALAAGIFNIGFLVAVTKGEVMRITLLFYLSPLWAVLLSRWWLKEKLPFIAIVMLVIAMCGSVIMLWHPSIGLPWPHDIADWLALTAGVAFAANNVLVRKLTSVPMNVKTTVTWWGVVITAITILAGQQASIPDVAGVVWLMTWVLGGGSIIMMTLATLYGVANMPIYRSSVIMLFELIVAAVSAWWLASEVMLAREALGGSLILLAGYGVVRATIIQEDKSEKLS